MPSKSTNTLNLLRVSLEAELGFEKDPSGKWLIHDRMEAVGDYGQYEVLPARARVSIDGTRYEVGARKEDLEGLLALARIVDKDAQGLDKVLSFWKESKVFSAKEEDGWVYIGRNIEPTTESFEVAFNAGGLAFNIVVSAAISNKTYQQMKDEKQGPINEVAYAENPTGRTSLFGPSIFDTLEGRRAPEDLSHHYPAEHSHRQRTQITANNLLEYPLHSPATWLHFCPGTIVRHRESKARKDISICGYNGAPEVFIASLDSKFYPENGSWEHDNVRLVLPIPDGIEIKTVAGMVNLHYATLLKDNNSKASNKIDIGINVKISVEPHAVYLRSEDGDFSLIIREPKCDNCEIPVWKFPFTQNRAVAGASMGQLYQTNTSSGILRYFFCGDDWQKTYCGNCIDGIVGQYIKEHPNADLSVAKTAVIDRLHQLGYTMVNVPIKGICPGRKETMFTAIVKYERGGREITRIVGYPTITHDGVFTPNMKPMEFVKFRYQPINR